MYNTRVKVYVRPFKPEYLTPAEAAEQCELEESTILHGSVRLFKDIKLIYTSLWKGHIEIGLFGKKNTVKVLIDTEDNEPVEPEQEEAFREYLSRKEELDALIISELRKGYGLDENFDLCKRFELNKLLIHSGGDFGFSFIDHNAEEGWSNRDVVVTVLPEVSYFGDEDDFF